MFEGLAGVFGNECLEQLLGGGHLLGLDLDVGRLALHTAEWLVHHDAGVRQRVALALGACAEEELSHRCAEAHADGAYVRADELHGVVDGHACGYRTAG